MKAYLAIAYLNRREWAADTVCASLRYGFELCLRKHLQDEGGEVIAAHVALFFEAPTPAVARDVARHLDAPTDAPTDAFFIDVLANGHHIVSTFDSGWYAQWDNVTVELYEIVDTNLDGVKFNAEAAYKRMIRYVEEQTPYDCYQNCNMICWYPCRCSPSCGLCPPCVNGTNCIEASIVSIAAGFGIDEYEAERRLGLEAKASAGARLPAKLRDELLQAGILVMPPRRLETQPVPSVPLLTMAR